jgi:cytochrome c5
MLARVPTILLLAALTWPSVTPAQMSMRGSAAEGRKLYYSTAIGNNGLACIHCHSDFDEVRRSDGKIRAAHPLYSGASRETWWGQEADDPDRYHDMAHAAVVCVVHYMLNPDKLTVQQLFSLQEYLKTINKRPATLPQPYTPAADKTGEYRGFEGGDRIEGRRLFHAACHTCHPNGNAGLAPLAIARDQPAAFYARKIREGDGLGSVLSGVDPNAYDPEAGLFMPFFGADRLSNQQIRDIIAFIKTLPASP